VTTTLTLVDGDRSLAIQPNDGVALQSLDLGWPNAREVVEERTDADGTVDTTAYHGPRVVSMTLTLYGPDRKAVVDNLRSFCSPRSRPYLLIDATPEWAQVRRVRLRSSDQSGVLLAVGQATTSSLQVSWVAPDGVLEGADAVETVVPASGATSQGVSFPLSFPMSFPAAASGTATTVTNSGNTGADPIVRMYGPCTGPRLSVDGGGMLDFPTLVIAAGDYVEINFTERSALVNSMADSSRYGYLTFATASWWQLQPGPNAVRFSPASFSGASQAVVTFRPTWL